MKFQFQGKLDLCSGNHVVYRRMDRQGESSTPIARPQEKSKSEGFDSCDRCSNLTQIRFKWSLFQPVLPWNLMDDLKQGKSEVFDSCDRPGNLTQNGFNRRFFSLCDLEIWWMASKNYRAPLPHYIKLCASFQSHQWIESGATVQKRSIRVKIGDFLSRVTLKFDGWPWKAIGHLFLCYNKLCAWFQSHCWIKTGVTVRKPSIQVKIGDFFVLCDLEIWQTTFKNNRAPVLCCFKLCASFHSHQWIQTKVTVRKLLIRVKSAIFFSCDLEIWWMTLKNNRAPLLCYIKLCVSFQSHRWIQSGVTVRKRSIRVKIGDFFVLCEIEIWRMTLKK